MPLPPSTAFMNQTSTPVKGPTSARKASEKSTSKPITLGKSNEIVINPTLAQTATAPHKNVDLKLNKDGMNGQNTQYSGAKRNSTVSEERRNELKELSMKLLHNYTTKAIKAQGSLEKSMVDDVKQNKGKDFVNHFKKQKRRAEGVKKAQVKIAVKSESALHELSKFALKQYKHNAELDSQRDNMAEPRAEKRIRVGKRIKGISLAKKKIDEVALNIHYAHGVKHDEKPNLTGHARWWDGAKHYNAEQHSAAQMIHMDKAAQFARWGQHGMAKRHMQHAYWHKAAHDMVRSALAQEEEKSGVNEGDSLVAGAQWLTKTISGKLKHGSRYNSFTGHVRKAAKMPKAPVKSPEQRGAERARAKLAYDKIINAQKQKETEKSKTSGDQFKLDWMKRKNDQATKMADWHAKWDAKSKEPAPSSRLPGAKPTTFAKPEKPRIRIHAALGPTPKITPKKPANSVSAHFATPSAKPTVKLTASKPRIRLAPATSKPRVRVKAVSRPTSSEVV